MAKLANPSPVLDWRPSPGVPWPSPGALPVGSVLVQASSMTGSARWRTWASSRCNPRSWSKFTYTSHKFSIFLFDLFHHLNYHTIMWYYHNVIDLVARIIMDNKCFYKYPRSMRDPSYFYWYLPEVLGWAIQDPFPDMVVEQHQILYLLIYFDPFYW